MVVYDSHAHVYPEKIAERAVAAIGGFYGIPMAGGRGTPDDLVASGSAAGVSHYLVHSTATSPAQVRAINDFIIAECRARPALFTGFGTLHPDMADPGAEVDYLVANGLRGVKLHADFQRFAVDGEAAGRLYRAAAGRLPILFHAGDRRYRYSNPSQLARVAERWPGLTLIAAHFGGYGEWEEAEKVLYGFPNVLFDTSSSLAFLEPRRAADMIRAAGAGKFLFGSDYPMWDHKAELARFLLLPLSEAEREAILFGNLARLLGLRPPPAPAPTASAPVCIKAPFKVE